MKKNKEFTGEEIAIEEINDLILITLDELEDRIEVIKNKIDNEFQDRISAYSDIGRASWLIERIAEYERTKQHIINMNRKV